MQIEGHFDLTVSLEVLRMAFGMESGSTEIETFEGL